MRGVVVDLLSLEFSALNSFSQRFNYQKTLKCYGVPGMKILQVRFKFKIPRAEMEKISLQAAPKFQPGGEVQGLLWKIWLINEQENLFSGIYLFKDDASIEAYLKGKLFLELKNNPVISDLEVKVFEILREHTKITRGPIE